MGRKRNDRLDEGWMDYLRERPKKANELIEQVQGQRVAEIKKTYSDVLTAADETKALLDNIVADMVALKERQKVEGGLINNWSNELQQASDDGEIKWNRLVADFAAKHGKRFMVYEQELASCEETFGRLRSLLSV